MLIRVEALHNKNLIHRDIKPENFVIGYHHNFNVIYMIDFGLAKYYKDSEDNHIPFIEKKGMIGTARYASVNAHLGYEQSRRDDLESLGYVLLYFSKGRLPWQNIYADTKEEKYEKIKNMKQSYPIENLCEGAPTEFITYFKHCKSLAFQATPNYSLLKNLFKKILIDKKLENFANTYDWEQIPEYKMKKKNHNI
jgi:serine/threonine protein kinase